MPNDYIAELTPKEANRMMADWLEISRKKMPEGLKSEEEYKEPFEYLCGDRSIFNNLHQGRYTNLIFPAWKAFAPKFCSRPPTYIVKQMLEDKRMLAEACQKLFAYKVAHFSYSDMILSVAQDAFFSPCGYGRHSWDEKQGLTVTKRFKPTNVMWDYTANEPSSAKWVIERHKVRRCDFAHKYGWKVAWKLEVCEGSENFTVEDKEKYPDGKHPLQEVEYYQLWSRINGMKRVYPFVDKWPNGLEDEWIHKSDEDGKPGEPWPLVFDEDEWHLTQLKLSNINGRIGGLSTWQACKGTYLQLQDLLGARTKAAEESAKKVLAYPQEMHNLMQKAAAAGGTLTMVPYDRAKCQVNNITESIQMIEFPGPDEHLIEASVLLETQCDQITGMNAVAQIKPQGVETAAEARTLSDASDNRVADDQGAVERWVTLVGKKELKCDLSKMPKRSSIRVYMSGYKDDYSESKKDKGKPIHDVPYEEACLLEKDIADVDAAKEQLEAAESKEMEVVLADGTPEDAKAAGDQMPMDPEVRARFNRKIPLSAKVEITNPGAEQFVGTNLANYWEEDLTSRQIESMLLVSIQLGSSSATGRSQKVNEVLMILKLMEPIYREFQLWDKLAFMYNSVLDASELESLKDAKLVGPELAAAMQKIQQQQEEAAAKQAEQEMALKMAANPLDPNVQLKAESESLKATSSVDKQALMNEGAQIKAVDGEARDRRRNESMLLQGQLGLANSGATGK